MNAAAGVLTSTIARENMLICVITGRAVIPFRMPVTSVVWSTRMLSVSPKRGRSSSTTRCCRAEAVGATIARSAIAWVILRCNILETVRVVVRQRFERDRRRTLGRGGLRRHDPAELRLEERRHLLRAGQQRRVTRAKHLRLVVPGDRSLHPIQRERRLERTERA